jgi:hypothetical protein
MLARLSILNSSRLRAIASTFAAVTLAGCGNERERPPVTPTANVIGERHSCISLPVREARVRDDWTVDFVTESGRVWRNTLTNRCSGLKARNSFTYATSLSQLCKTDIIYVLEPGLDLHRGQPCGLGDFVPMKLENSATSSTFRSTR